MAVKNKSLPLLNICKVEKQMGHFYFSAEDSSESDNPQLTCECFGLRK